MSVRARRRRPALLAVAPLLLGSPMARSGVAGEAGAPSLRESIESLGARLDRAVGQVSRPAPGIVLGRAESARGYHLPGYGAVFVLTPRALPREGQLYVLRRRAAPPGTATLRIETRVEGSASDPEAAERLAAQAQRLLGMVPGRRPEPAAPGSEDPEAQELMAIEQQVLEFQRQAEEARQDAEREIERLTRDLRERLEAPAGSPRPAAPPAPSAAPRDPVAVAPPPAAPTAASAATVAPASAPAPPAVPPPPPGEAPLPPPWRFWFQTVGPPDQRAPDEVVADVRGAVIATLDSEGTRLRLAADEYVAVAVDFVPAGVFVSHARPARTLVIRARKQDLDARRAGKLSGEDLRGRIEVSEY